MNDIVGSKFEVLRTDIAPKLRVSRGTLDYSLIRTKGKLAFIIDGNFNLDGDVCSGKFWAKKLLLSDISKCLETQKFGGVFSFSSSIFEPLFKNELSSNNNNRAFIGAILRHEGLISQLSEGSFEHILAVKVNEFEQHLLRE